MIKQEFYNVRDLSRVQIAIRHISNIACIEQSPCSAKDKATIIGILTDWEEKLFKIIEDSIDCS